MLHFIHTVLSLNQIVQREATVRALPFINVNSANNSKAQIN